MIPDVKRRLAEAYKNLQDAVVSVDTILHVSCSGSSYTGFIGRSTVCWYHRVGRSTLCTF